VGRSGHRSRGAFHPQFKGRLCPNPARGGAPAPHIPARAATVPFMVQSRPSIRYPARCYAG
jgi:hypothetical protein